MADKLLAIVLTLLVGGQGHGQGSYSWRSSQSRPATSYSSSQQQPTYQQNYATTGGQQANTYATTAQQQNTGQQAYNPAVTYKTSGNVIYATQTQQTNNATQQDYHCGACPQGTQREYVTSTKYCGRCIGTATTATATTKGTTTGGWQGGNYWDQCQQYACTPNYPCPQPCQPPPTMPPIIPPYPPTTQRPIIIQPPPLQCPLPPPVQCPPVQCPPPPPIQCPAPPPVQCPPIRCPPPVPGNCSYPPPIICPTHPPITFPPVKCPAPPPIQCPAPPPLHCPPLYCPAPPPIQCPPVHCPAPPPIQCPAPPVLQCPPVTCPQIPPNCPVIPTSFPGHCPEIELPPIQCPAPPPVQCPALPPIQCPPIQCPAQPPIQCPSCPTPIYPTYPPVVPTPYPTYPPVVPTPYPCPPLQCPPTRCPPNPCQYGGCYQGDDASLLNDGSLTNSTNFKARSLKEHVNRPIVHVEPVQVSAKTGDKVVLNCTVEGEEPLKFYWKKGDTAELPEHITISRDGHALIFKSVEKQDEGEYFCVARNNQSQSAAKASVLVDLDTNLIEEMEQYEPSTFSQTVSLSPGSDVALQCSLSNPSWSRKEGQLPDSAEQQENGSLKLSAVSEEDEGTYVCASSTTNALVEIIFKLNTSEGNAMTCEKGQFMCKSGEKCIPQEERCDTEDNCLDGSDEESCH